MKPQNLWTYDFTVITVGSLISMVGSSMSGFAISLVVLDYTGSTFLYMLFNVCSQLPMLVCPVLAGPLLDRVSRKKTIYRLDFLSAGIYLLLFFLLRGGWFNYPLLLAGSVLIGCTGAVYSVAYDSFYPNLIAEGNYQKAYSVSSMVCDLAGMTLPLAAAVYDWLDSAAPVFAFNALCFFTAACFERTIRFEERHMEAGKPASGAPLGQFLQDFTEGMDYIRGEKGLLLIALYFMVGNNFFGSVDGLYLPFFRSSTQRFAAWPVATVTLYAIVSNFDVVGRLFGGMVQYKVRFPSRWKFSMALCVYVSLYVLSGAMLFLPVPLMAAAFFCRGVLGVTSYTIRTAATQSYVPDTMRARFNGAFQMLTYLGMVAGSLTVGALAEVLPERAVVVGGNVLGLLSVYLFIYRGRAHVANVYNRE